MFICKFCGREAKNNKSNYLHECRCKYNPNRPPHLATSWNKGKKSTVPPWNKGLVGIKGSPHSEATKLRLSEVAKSRKLGGYVKGSGRGKKGWYRGFFCDSSWELAYVIYCIDHNIRIIRNYENRHYIWEGQLKNYIPDFIVEDVLTEIKGYKTKQWMAKLQYNPDVRVLYQEDLKHVFNYVHTKYGKNFIELYE